MADHGPAAVHPDVAWRGLAGLECAEIETRERSVTLKERLIRLIETGGPIPVSTYMQLCLHDTAQGYYATRPGIGKDFIRRA